MIQRRAIRAGESVGYGATFVADRDMAAGVLNIGYADGYFRLLGPAGAAWAGEVRCPVLGRVSMDLMVVALGDAPAGEGDWLAIAFELADAASASGLSQYELLTGPRPSLSAALDMSVSRIAAGIVDLFAGIGRLSPERPGGDRAGRRVRREDDLARRSPRLIIPARLVQQLGALGWQSLPVVGLTAIFTGAALAQQIYTAGSRFSAQVHGAGGGGDRHGARTGAGAGGADGRGPRRLRDGGRTRHDARDRAAGRDGHAAHRSVPLPDLAAPVRRGDRAAVAGADRQFDRHLRRLSAGGVQARLQRRSATSPSRATIFRPATSRWRW